MNCNQGTLKLHVETPKIPLIRSNNYEKPEKCCVKIKLRRDPTSQKSDPYKLKTTLFDNGDPEDFLLFISNFSTTIKA